MNVLWVDDDSFGVLSSLAWFLRDAGASVERIVNYDAAVERLEQPSIGSEKAVLLVDIILPRAQGMGALSPYLGINLAERGLELGISRLSFLTVVPYDEVADEIERLQRTHSGREIPYHDKKTLLEPNGIESLLESLGLKPVRSDP